MKSLLAILVSLFCAFGLVSGHDDMDLRGEAIYPFKQQVYDLCSGHGLMHLNAEEMSDLCEKLAKNLDDIRDLQENPRHDIFLSNLTGLIIRSPVPQNVKNDLLRKSYQMSKEKSSEGDEWHYTVLRLIEESNVLSHDEVSSHVNSQNRQLKGAATRFLEQNPENAPKRPERRRSDSDVESKTSAPGMSASVDDPPSKTGQTGSWRHWIIGVISVGIIGFLIVIWRTKSSH